jgi:hypothetical protein
MVKNSKLNESQFQTLEKLKTKEKFLELDTEGNVRYFCGHGSDHIEPTDFSFLMSKGYLRVLPFDQRSLYSVFTISQKGLDLLDFLS